MHPSAMSNAKSFFDAYIDYLETPLVVDIGAQDVNGSLKSVTPNHAKYLGVDFVAGKGVDVVLDDPYQLPFEDNSIDIILSSSCFEHSDMFWILFLEILRVLKPEGLFYLNAPSNGPFHRYPVDSWRFYPDCGQSLVTWGKRNGYSPALLESYISKQDKDVWNDYVAIFIKEEEHMQRYQHRILESKKDFYNGKKNGCTDFLNPKIHPQAYNPVIANLKSIILHLIYKASKN